ncbi:l-ascorbate oxidase [Moniliophthora roreri]|uniref:Peroxidase n=1 Tax=Moniliophthora roreri TaxID=221103 RepID=A0A0W0FPQ2_MONRR|nr:l-ascorbate oxidase [Moniliophthora roreri]
MSSHLAKTVLGSIVLHGLAARAYHWPDPQVEYADKVLFGDSFLSAIAIDCAPRDETTIAAQWVRIAYHDMATHNVDDGTGGLDGSIAYELDRPENIGSGMLASINDFVLFTSPATGLADTIAMGAVIGVAACGGPIVPFRAGRVDATAAGPPGVPEPQQDLASHTESFRRQGFTESEMIALVACGHTLGGVRREDFPEVIHDTSVNLTTFDSTIQFDNVVVTEYLSGTTNNPLVVGPNTTTNSDLRIFSSDKNVTMQSIALPDSFSKTCSSLFERMVNTVPKDVKLSEVVEPIKYKVGDTRLFPDSDSTFTLSTNLRLLSSNAQRTVTLFWADRQGSVCGTSGCSVQPTSSRRASFTYLTLMRGITEGTQYTFSAKINMTSSISRFWFQINEGDGSEPVVVDNGGSGYVIDQDTVLLDLGRSKRIFTPDFSNPINFVVAASLFYFLGSFTH